MSQEAKKSETEEKTAPIAAEGKEAEAGAKPKKKRAKKAKLTEGRVYINATYNNTIITVADMKGNTALWASAGSCGFKGTRKSTPYAAQIAAETALNKAKLLGFERAHIFVKGIGLGRDQALRGIASTGIDMQSITDITPLPHGGVRPRKPRRV